MPRPGADVTVATAEVPEVPEVPKVGAPVKVSCTHVDTSLAKSDVSELRCCGCLRARLLLLVCGYSAFVMEALAVIEVFADFTGAVDMSGVDRITFRAFRVLRIMPWLFLFCLLWRSPSSLASTPSVAPGCCSGSFLPRSLALLALVHFGYSLVEAFLVAAAPTMQDFILLGIFVLEACLKVAVFRLWLPRPKSAIPAVDGSTEATGGAPRDMLEEVLTGSASPATSQARFSAIIAEDGRKFEGVYVIAEFLAVVTYVVYKILIDTGCLPALPESLYTVAKVHQVVAPACLVLRICRCFVPAVVLRREWAGTTLDAFIFAWYSGCAGVLDQGGMYMVSSFFVSNMLSYMLIFVFPFRRAVIVVPLCFVGNCVGSSLPFLLGNIVDDPIDRSLAEEVLEKVLLGVGLCLSLAARRVIERSKWETFFALEVKSRQALQEKVLRCQAEFTRDIAGSRLSGWKRAHSDLPSTEERQASRGCADTPLRTSANAPPNAARPPSSFRSAPALLLGGTGSRQSQASMSPLVQGCLDGDCLPPEAQTWVEGDAIPRPVVRLQPGDRVLCFDRLGGSMKHTQVLRVSEADGPTEWTSVTLADGTMLEVTADHPVHPAPAPGTDWGPYGPSLGPPIRASELEPGRDSLLVLKVVPVPVRSVLCRKADGARRISVTLHQPERHAMFVASAGSARPGTVGLQTVAVESADATGFGRGQFQHKNSFLDVAAYAPDPLAATANSEPPSLGRNSEMRCMQALCDAPPTALSSQSPPSTVSQSSESLDDPTAVLHLPGQLHSAWEIDKEPVSLGEMLRIKAAGWSSRGSIAHAAGSCHACVHENNAQLHHKRPCMSGGLCDFCHDSHHDMKASKRERRKQQRFETKSQKRLQISGGDGYGSGS